MAANSELITFGIGTPSTIPHLLTFGVSQAVVGPPGPPRASRYRNGTRLGWMYALVALIGGWR